MHRKMHWMMIFCLSGLAFGAPFQLQGYEYDFHQFSPADLQYLKEPQIVESDSHKEFHTSGTAWQSQSHNYYEPPEPVVSKRFYLHSAPDDDDEEIQHQTLIFGKARKNYNVVFIRAPGPVQQKTRLHITPAAKEEKTIIYILAKQPEERQIEAEFLEPITPTLKPEVYFIKYKTPAEAEHAQQIIQAQYNKLEGPTHISDEGNAPVSSVVGSLDAIEHAEWYNNIDNNGDVDYVDGRQYFDNDNLAAGTPSWQDSNQR